MIDKTQFLLDRLNLVVADIESTELKSDKGYLLCCGFYPLRGNKKPYVISLRDTGLNKDPLYIDKKLAIAIRSELESYDGAIWYNGLKFDKPFINDRLMLAGEREVEPRFTADLFYYFMMFKSCFTSRKLDWISRILNVASRKTPLDLTLWKLADYEARGGFRAGHSNFDQIVHHCLMDIKVTREVYERGKHRIKSLAMR